MGRFPTQKRSERETSHAQIPIEVFGWLWWLREGSILGDRVLSRERESVCVCVSSKREREYLNKRHDSFINP